MNSTGSLPISRRTIASAVAGAILVAAVIGCGGGSSTGSSGARTLYVRALGSDGNDGTAPTRALATLATALARAGGGDTIIVGPGAYVPTGTGSVLAVLDITSKRAGAERPLVFLADPTGALTGDPPGEVLLDAQRELHGVRITRSTGIVLDGFVITGTRGANAAGIQIRSASGDITIRNCEIRDNDADGVRIEASDRTLIFNNLIHQNGLRGIQLSGGGSGSIGTRIINNTLAHNGNDGISVGSATLPTRSTFVRNNLVYRNGQRGIDAERGSSLAYDADYNLVFPLTRDGIAVGYGPLTPKGLHDLGVDPNLTAGYRLAQVQAGQAFNSPAIDAGDPETPEPLRSQLRARTTATNEAFDTGVVDIGFHYRSSLPPPTATPTPVPPETPSTRTPTMTASPTPTHGAFSRKLYVRTDGNDTRDGAVPERALRTIQRALDNALPGTEIVVGPGTYEGALSITAHGTLAEPMALRGDPSGRETGDSPGEVVVTSGGSGTGVFVDGARFWTVEGLTVTGSGIGMHVRREAPGTVLRNNEIYGNGDDGIRLQDATGAVLFNNLIYCNGRRGILVAGASSGSIDTRIVNNTIVGNADRGLFIGTNTVASRGSSLRNNLIQDNCGNGIQIVASSLQGYDGQYNLLSPPTYVGTTVHPTDTAYDPQTQGAVQRPARFVTRAFCEAVCRTPGRPENEIPSAPTIERHADDFRLAQTIAGQDPPDSVGIDAGDPALPSEFAVALRRRTTATNDEPDGGRLDIGYHFPRAATSP